MLTHIVCWKYKAETTAAERQNHIDRLRALVGVIPEIISFEVGADILHLERSFDTGLVSTFAGREELTSYSDHPEHLKVAALGREISERVVSVDFIND
jgi:hypothetical protein